MKKKFFEDPYFISNRHMLLEKEVEDLVEINQKWLENISIFSNSENLNLYYIYSNMYQIHFNIKIFNESK